MARLVAAITRAADLSVDDASAAERLARTIVGTLGDGCTVDVAHDVPGRRRDGRGPSRPERRVALHVEASRVGRMQALFPPGAPDTPVARALASGRSHAWFDVRDAPRAVADAVASLGARSVLIVPGGCRGRTTVVVTLVSGGRRAPLDAFDLALARDVAARIAVAYDHARSYRNVRDSVRSRDELLAAVSHDLRDPLSAISAGASVLRRVAPAEAAVGRAIELVARNAGRMHQLVRNLLDLARHESSGLRLEVGVHAPRAIVYDALDTLGPVAAEKGVQLEARMPAELPPVRCDREATLRVLTNLVSNAIKFTPSGGAIRLRVVPLGSEIRVAVSDTGAGIARTDVGHVFDRYWQAGRAGRTGSGLGLSIAKAIVEQTGGSIWLESHVGVGTTFYFTVPVAA
jgi:signal transduction histidine kinase